MDPEHHLEKINLNIFQIVVPFVRIFCSYPKEISEKFHLFLILEEKISPSPLDPQ